MSGIFAVKALRADLRYAERLSGFKRLSREKPENRSTQVRKNVRKLDSAVDVIKMRSQVNQSRR